jgi:hypothetical protein
MTDLNSDCWNAIAIIGGNEGGEIVPAVLGRLELMGLVTLDEDGTPRLTARGEEAYVALESGEDFPGLE